MMNRSTKSLKRETPSEKWNGRKLNIEHQWVLASIVHVNMTRRLNELEDRSEVMVFIGLDPYINKVHISQNFMFEESKSWDFEKIHQGSEEVLLTKLKELVK